MSFLNIFRRVTGKPSDAHAAGHELTQYAHTMVAEAADALHDANVAFDDAKRHETETMQALSAEIARANQRHNTAHVVQGGNAALAARLDTALADHTA